MTEISTNADTGEHHEPPSFEASTGSRALMGIERAIHGGVVEHPGGVIGPYTLIKIIGEGGFGEVWLAERSQPMIQRVALKIIKPGMDSAQVIARFQAERQALAVMDHPNVARVFDGGVTSGGRPYFVMEYVVGEAITAYCDGKQLDITDRLVLFIAVCEAVQHAHTKGIIHRDIKPSNVLIATIDGKPVVKVIDFGVAKAVSHTSAEATLFTQVGVIIGTPEYMSPEQASGDIDIDTRTDVYSLGVLLYELLTGLLPFDSSELRRAGYIEIQRIIREVEPHKPSTRLFVALSGFRGPRTTQGSARTVGRPEAIAANRRTDNDHLIRTLRRELEWIPLKAMCKARNERYRSAAELVDELRRYLTGKPLVAGPESRWYRGMKLIKRNKGPVLSGVTVVLALVLGFGTALVQRYAAITQRIQAELDRTTAIQQQRRAEQLVQILDGQQEWEIEQLSTFGSMLSAKRLYAEALELSEMGRDLGERRLGVSHPRTILHVHDQAMLYRAQGRLVEAESPARQALQQRQSVLGLAHPDTLLSVELLADILGEQRRDSEALAVLESVEETACGALTDRKALQFASFCVNLGLTRMNAEFNHDRFLAAESNFLEASAIRRARNGRFHKDSGYCVWLLMKLYKSWNRAEPNAGYDVLAAVWEAEFEDIRPRATSPTSEDSK